MSSRVRQLAIGSLVTGLAITLAACGGTNDSVAATRSESLLARSQAPTAAFFAPNSVFNVPLSPNAPVDPSSPILVARLVEEVEQEQRAHSGPWIETTSYSTPVYRVPRNQATVSVKLDNHAPWARTLQAALRAVPIPPKARPAAGTDAQITIWQPSTDRLWELWRASKQRDGWHALWGGAIRAVSRSPGYYTANSWPGARSYWGASATSLPLVGGMMTIAELEHGSINHALAIDLPTARAGVYAWPAQRTDGEDPSPSSIPEGARLRISPSLDIPTLNLPPLTEEMAIAAQRYGMIVRDQTHHAIGFYAEDPTPTGSNPYPKLMNYETPAEALAAFPWTDVEVTLMSLRYGAGRPAQ
jgi:hypothetical protein